ncbi:FkbM family methyltransferase [Lachnospiraceae bacterium]|nr:FkbM family methyltransferase [Lachnospiraceae bacterium]
MRRYTSTKTDEVKTITLDQFVKTNHISRIDFIKADIEGAERLLLSGAKEVLQKFAPKLSLCTYHYPEDTALLEFIIKQANPNYVIEKAYHKLYAYVNK